MIKQFLTASACALLAISSMAFEGRVVGVSDGDTITVLDSTNKQHKIRLGGVDAPESSQDFGNRSKQSLSALVFGKTVSVPDSKTDKYGRTVSRVFVNGVDAGLAQVQQGMAWHYKQYEKEQSMADRLSYAAAEQQARANRLGLWLQVNPQRPDEYRHGGPANKQAVQTALSAECPCGASNICTGPKGGKFCMTGEGQKKYIRQ